MLGREVLERHQRRLESKIMGPDRKGKGRNGESRDIVMSEMGKNCEEETCVDEICNGRAVDVLQSIQINRRRPLTEKVFRK